MADGQGQTVALAPVRGKARIDVMDMLRGIAILGIFYMNIPFMGNHLWMEEWNIRSIGWTVADRNAWAIIQTTWEGTQRCLLEYLFGAGMMVLTAKAMEPTGPVAVADLYIRRNLWLLLFGLADIFLFLWPGDILHIYALSALFLFPFRLLKARMLVIIGLIFSTLTFVGVPGGGVMEYVSRTKLVHTVETAHAAQAAHKPLTKDQSEALKTWQKKLDRIAKPEKEIQQHIDEETKAHANGGFLAYAGFLWQCWFTFIGKGSLLFGIIEAFSTMCIGIALWKWGVIQGQRSTRFYVAMLVIGYGLGMGARALGVWEVTRFAPIPKTIWFTNEYARLLVGLGHIALVNLLIRNKIGAMLMAPFKAAGRTAFSLYFLEQTIGLYILFSPFGFNLWGKYSWAGLAYIATATWIVLLIVANVWVRYFQMGPMEWAWRSLAYWKRQPFRHAPVEPVIIVGP